MDPSAFSSAFPPLVSSSSPSLPKPPSWDRILTGSPNPTEFSISMLQTPEEIIPFQQDDIAEANDEWSLALVGYSLGRRPFYETLLKAIRKSWILKGTLKLISLSEGFFLFKFSTLEDYEMVWLAGLGLFSENRLSSKSGRLISPPNVRNSTLCLYGLKSMISLYAVGPLLVSPKLQQKLVYLWL
ncbi:hypothetical protein M5K25_008262 [Dendrobium thyrsiflorum]|uniref:DUF4283 domain-containing protein n=1 Tax=Dendrobium thyrsiflorum TaxID=117978 RepID=A0ABD0V885_DENTH